MALSLQSLSRELRDNVGMYVYILLVVLATLLVYNMLMFGISAVIGKKLPLVPTLVVLAILGILIGVLAQRFFPDLKYQVRHTNLFVAILAGAVLFAVLNAVFTIYTLTVGTYSIFSSMPLVSVPFTEFVYKLVLALVDGFIKGVILFATALLGLSI